ncbi:MAG: class I SAM-dependent methyltransferase [Nitrospira sp.]|nr:class I SAM-dependent methyltransferase [Nitrospira sp.]
MVKRIRWTSELVNKFWDGVAQTELDNLSFGKVAGPKFLELISKYLLPGGSHLDFGAGSGHVLQLLLDRGLNAAGFEPSPDRQDLLVGKIGQHKHFLGVKGVDSSDQFDVVLLMEVLEHVLDEDFDKVLERVKKFVKPGGYLIASTPNNENVESSSVYCPVSEALFHPWQHVRSFTPHQISDCFKNLGFAPELIALADFSSDAELVESYKKIAALRELSDYIESAVHQYHAQRQELALIDAFLGSGVRHGFWQKIKLRVNLLFQHRVLIGKLHSIAHDMTHRFDEVSCYALNQIRDMRDPILSGAAGSTRDADGIDLRIGRETTIVYVGKKQ